MKKSAVIHHHRSSIMTYQNPTLQYDGNADADADVNESSSLFLTVADASPPPSSAFGQDGVAATKKKKNGGPMRAVIATCVFLLGALTVLYSVLFVRPMTYGLQLTAAQT